MSANKCFFTSTNNPPTKDWTCAICHQSKNRGYLLEHEISTTHAKSTSAKTSHYNGPQKLDRLG
ncbi:MAG: hypothetical protein ACD_7C00399G0001 [uncultured bacterium]|nr:MAG: hypothetical protein ACD_7C00399G0001 [uncultured bacterium]